MSEFKPPKKREVPKAELVAEFLLLSKSKLGLDYEGDAECMKVINGKNRPQLTSAIFKMSRMADYVEDAPAAEVAAEEIEERRTSDGTGHGRAKSSLLSERQEAFIISLTLRKNGIDLKAKENAELLAALKKISSAQAHKMIDSLKDLPDYVAPVAAKVEATPAKEETPDPAVLPGRYVVKGLAVKVTQGKKGTQWFGKIFVREIESDRLIRGEERKEILAYIFENPAECALEFTQLYGQCSNCGRTLTNEVSIAEAMGPICSGRFGAAYGVTILGEVWEEPVKRGRKTKAEPVTEEEPVWATSEATEKPKAIAKAPSSIATGTATQKAQKVVAAIKAIGEDAFVACSDDDVTTVTAMIRGQKLQVTWDGVSFRYGADSTLGGKRFRNVSELLRLIG